MTNKGFSLIELLISITIIGVLATIILSSLSNARAKAYDSKVKQQLSSFRTAAEVFFYSEGPDKVPSGPNTYGINNNCHGNPESLFRNIKPSTGQPGLYIDPANLPDGANIVCQSVEDAYAVKVSLYSGTDYWCVDSTGASRVTIDGTQQTFCP